MSAEDDESYDGADNAKTASLASTSSSGIKQCMNAMKLVIPLHFIS